MRKIIIQILTILLLSLYIGCTDDSINKEVVSLEKQTITKELPENAISVTTLLQQQKGNLKNVYEAQSKLSVYYKKFFVLYPTDWSYNDRLSFLGTTKKNRFNGREVFVVNEGCTYIDTWYVAYTIPPVDKGKNLIVASDPDVDTGDGSDEGPGEVPSGNEENYSSCHDIPLPTEYYLSSSVDIVMPEAPDENNVTPIQ